MVKMRTKWGVPRILLACLVSLAALASRSGSVLCQGHFKPMVHAPRPQPALYARNVYAQHGAHRPMVPNKSLMGSLGGRGQSYLNQVVQQRIQQQQQLLQRHVPPMSDRRASAPSSSAAAQQLFSPSMPAGGPSHQVPFSSKLRTQAAASASDQNKLLICYYTTKQTAPYWPRDAREFVVPADRLNQIVSSFSQQQQPNSHSDRFSAREPDNGQQRHSNSLSLAAAANDDAQRQHNQAEAHTLKQSHNQAQQINSFAGGRMFVVAPKFVPFNRTTNNIPSNSVINEPAAELSPSSLAQMFFMPNNNEQHQRHHNTIANRQDNAASFTSSTSATNQPPGQQSLMANHLAAVPRIVANNNNLGGSGNGGIVFGKTPRGGKQHDLNGEERNNNNNNNRIDAGGPPLTINSQQASSSSSHTRTNLPHRNNNGQPTQQRPNANNNNNNQRQLEQMKDQQQQLIFSASSSQPSMSRTFMVGASLAAPLVAGQAALDSGQDQFGLGQTVPLTNNGDYYYYYNQPQSSASSPPPPQPPRGAGGSSGPTAAATLSLATSPYQPLPPMQQQRAKSLQVAESELSPALPASSLAPSLTFVESPSDPMPPAYSIMGQTTLDRLIVGDGPPPPPPPATTTTNVRHPQQYSSGTSSQSTSFASTGGDDGTTSSGTKTTPIASIASPSSSSPLVASQQHQLVATLPSSLIISYPPPTSIAPAQAPPPNGSSTASLTKSGAQTATSAGSATNFDADAAAAAATNGNNRHHQHQHQHNNRQIVGVGGNSLSATLVSSPLSTMFDVFGAASQYLMRFKPSSLISPSSFATLNSIVGGDASSSGHHHSSRSNSSSSSSPLISLPFASGILGGSGGGSSSGLHGHKSNTTSDSGFLSRLSLQTHQRREDICGRTIQIPEKRIIGGEGAKYGEFPYQVHIKIAKHQCGGALIDKQSIVTAAHCVYHFITRAPVSKLQIVIGAYDIEDEQYQELPPQYFKVNRVKLHPNFRFSASHPDRYDIAILKLDKPVKYTDNVLPVCLPGKDLKYENMVGTVTGFGKTDPSLSNRYGTRLLQKVDVPIIENGECERWHRTRGIDLKIFPEMMCAGYEDGLKDACVGDSGGPLVVKTPVGSNGSFRWTLAGITSAGFGCAQSRQPGIYHRVSHTVDWILDNLD